MKRIILILCFFTFNAQASSFGNFYQGFKNAFYLNTVERGRETSDHVRLTKFGRIGRIFSPDASATYNDKTNTISLDESLLTFQNGKYQAEDARVILTSNYSGFSTVATIFHELGHAEVDIFIENERKIADLTLKHFYQTKLKPLYRKYFKGINPWTVFHEHFAYYRTDLIETLSLDIMDLMMENGWNAQKGTCYLTVKLKKMLENGVSLEEFLIIETEKTRSYRSVTPGYIFVRGKDLNLAQVTGSDAEVLKEAHAHFWNYHQEFYGFSKNISEVAMKMNKDPKVNKLKQCRENFYRQL